MWIRVESREKEDRRSRFRREEPAIYLLLRECGGGKRLGKRELLKHKGQERRRKEKGRKEDCVRVVSRERKV
jgi:hypothetical protein